MCRAIAGPTLFRAVVGGHGYLGVVTDATYRVVAIDAGSVAHTTITRHSSFRVADRRAAALGPPNGDKPLGLRPPFRRPGSTIQTTRRNSKARVFESRYAPPGRPPRGGFPLYNDIESELRYLIEVLARIPVVQSRDSRNPVRHRGQEWWSVRERAARLSVLHGRQHGRQGEIRDEAQGAPFPIVQQTYVVPADATESFAVECETQMKRHGIEPTECDMLYVKQDDCLMSANYPARWFRCDAADSSLSLRSGVHRRRFRSC